ncbi:hypothetical protein EDC02_7787 [Micromonospora sp. Llam0]|uniref:hypothetical protein n=1 Tax=Micromonospora sp. Llam0 TaxID=2485143 RepID=UPI000F476BFA|nr:hypothetical protein [Micromonospora sp. Llam0]ROO52843.1 hypothetical protein EDC02_7787 [Micromonospora sp. Llam0]
MGHMLLAVLVPATATVDTVDADLDRIIEPQLETLGIDDYRLGGGFTGARDPANHEPLPAVPRHAARPGRQHLSRLHGRGQPRPAAPGRSLS